VKKRSRKSLAGKILDLVGSIFNSLMEKRFQKSKRVPRKRDRKEKGGGYFVLLGLSRKGKLKKSGKSRRKGLKGSSAEEGASQRRRERGACLHQKMGRYFQENRELGTERALGRFQVKRFSILLLQIYLNRGKKRHLSEMKDGTIVGEKRKSSYLKPLSSKFPKKRKPG